jgi:hypothetical protein
MPALAPPVGDERDALVGYVASGSPPSARSPTASPTSRPHHADAERPVGRPFEELARHAGHADILREAIDGATMYERIGGREGWPETDWLKPWRPPAESA